MKSVMPLWFIYDCTIDGKELFMNVLRLLQLYNPRVVSDVRLLFEKLVRGIGLCVLMFRVVMLGKVLLSNARIFWALDTSSV
jgi:hypothetical protein